MLEELVREAMAASTRAAAKAADYGDPDGKKFPIMSQASVMAAARLLGRAKGYDDAKRAAVKARIIRIAKRKGYTLPRSWQTGKKEAVEDLSNEMVAASIQAALSEETDPDMDGDDDSDDWTERPIVRHVFPLAPVPYCIFQMGWDGEWYSCTYTIDDNDEATLGADRQCVRPVLSFVKMTDDDDKQESAFVIVPEQPEAVVTPPVAKTEGHVAGKSTEFRERLESASFREATVGADDMFHITGTAINPGVNRSGTRIYPKETLAAALPLFKGAKMYIDHPSLATERNLPERSVMEIGGKIERAWLNNNGGIDYSAVVIDPVLREKLALMNKADALDAMGTSVNYMGKSSDVTHEGRTLENIEEFSSLRSLDFVTEAGAWGTVAQMESLGRVPQEERNDDVTNEELTKLVESMAATVGTLTTQVTGLVGRTAKTEVRTELRALIAESKLPKESADIILEHFKDAEQLDGATEMIAQHVALVTSLRESLKPKPTADPKKAGVRRVERVVIGMGDTAAKGEGNEEEENLPEPNAELFAESFSRMFGGEEAAKKFYDRFA